MAIPKKYEDVVAERDAALAREDALREELATSRVAFKEELAGWKARCSRRVDDIKLMVEARDALQQRLTVAEQLLRRSMEYGGMTPDWRESVEAALKPAADDDSSSPEFTKKEGKSARIPSGLKKDQIVEVFGGGQTQIARVDKTDWRHVEMWRVKP